MLGDITCAEPDNRFGNVGGLSWGSIGDGRGQQEVVGAAVVVIRNKYAIVADQLFG